MPLQQAKDIRATTPERKKMFEGLSYIVLNLVYIFQMICLRERKLLNGNQNGRCIG